MWSDQGGRPRRTLVRPAPRIRLHPNARAPGSEVIAVGYRPAVSTTARWPRELFLVRHGESAGNVARDLAESSGEEWIDIADRDMDVPLSDRGIEQAQALGSWLQDLGPRAPAVALASPYRRAADTAKAAIAAAGPETPVGPDGRLRGRGVGVLHPPTHKGVLAPPPNEAGAPGPGGEVS